MNDVNDDETSLALLGFEILSHQHLPFVNSKLKE
jgi:hypothetical protein